MNKECEHLLWDGFAFTDFRIYIMFGLFYACPSVYDNVKYIDCWLHMIEKISTFDRWKYKVKKRPEIMFFPFLTVFFCLCLFICQKVKILRMHKCLCLLSITRNESTNMTSDNCDVADGLHLISLFFFSWICFLCCSVFSIESWMFHATLNAFTFKPKYGFVVCAIHSMVNRQPNIFCHALKFVCRTNQS